MSIIESNIEQLEKLKKYRNIQLFDKYVLLLFWATILGLPVIAIINNAYIRDKSGLLGLICLIIILSLIITLIIRLKINHCPNCGVYLGSDIWENQILINDQCTKCRMKFIEK
jgi:hypothetical protein